eukprot:766054-Hanusia_phi.AAC.4
MVDGRFSPAMFTFGYQDHFAPQAQNNFSNVLSRLNDDLSDLCHKISSPHHHTPWGAMKSYDNDLLPHQAAHRLPSLPGAARQDAGAGDPGGQMNGISLLERKEWQEKNGHRDAGGSDKKFVPRPQVDKFEKWMNTKVDHLMKDIGLIQNQLHTRRGQGQLIDDLRQRVEQLEARTKNSGRLSGARGSWRIDRVDGGEIEYRDGERMVLMRTRTGLGAREDRAGGWE